MIFNSLEAIPFPDSACASGVHVHLLCNTFLFNLHILGFFFQNHKRTHHHCKKPKET